MPRHDLNDARDKLRWAKKHFQILRSQVEPFEERDSHTISVEIDADQGKYTFYVHDLEVTDPDWGLMMGDCLQNARTALDYVAVALWARITGIAPEDIKGISFPVYNDPQQPPPAIGKMRKEPAFSGYLARIEELQPFNAFNPSVWGWGPNATPAGLPFALDRLSSLNNIDKHRVIHATWLGVEFGGWFRLDRDAPDDFVPLTGSTTLDPLKDGAQIGEYLFQPPLSRKWKPSEVQMKGYFPIQVAFPDPSPVKGVLEVLPWCLSAVEAAITIFAPVFENATTPLPVTAVRTVRG